ncbi:MAG: biotin/lipoyl-containing protein [Salinarimonas sp.]
MPHEVTMPQLGMTQDSGRLTQWLKQPGDKVARGDLLFEVETDKATMEIEAQADGFLTHVKADEGADIPVGKVIARISDTASETADALDEPAATPEAEFAPAAGDALPKGHAITMPQLGMTQDSGVLVAWLKLPGDAVGAEDILFEVETDKSTMEVAAGHDGYLAATLAEPGEAVAVGGMLAIISASPPSAPVARSAAQMAAKPAPADAKPAPAQAEPTAVQAPPAVTPQAVPGSEGRILASPKLRRIALAEELDLARLVRAGHPQPFHMRDLEILRSLPEETLPQGVQKASPHAAAAAAAMRLTASSEQDGFAAFARWAGETHGLADADALLAGLAGASLPGGPGIVAVERFGARRAFLVPNDRRLSAVAPSDEAPALILRDLRATAVESVAIGAETLPVITITGQGAGLSITLECGPGQMDGPAAIALLDAFAGRMREPLRHLL